MTTEVESYVGAELQRETNWWGAFVVGLAGTLLVTGVTGPVLAGMGSAAIPNFFFVTLTGWLLCLFLAELAAMLPDRTGGAPAYAYFAFKDRMPKLYPHINGLTLWAYWMGWWPVMGANNLLIGAYLIALFGFPAGPLIQLPGSVAVGTSSLILGAVIALLLFIPAYLGIRFGTVFATILGVLSIVPLTVLAVLPFFNPSTIHTANVFPFVTPTGAALFSGAGIALSIQYWALLTWNVIAMEAAACYIAECKDPEKDAPIAMNLEGGYGAFIYTLIPFSMLAVLGLKAIQADPLALFSTFAGHVFNVPGLNYIMTFMLVAALGLSSLNAIMGVGRSLYQMSLDGQTLKIFAHKNKHGVPDVSMFFNVLLNIAVMLFGAPAVIYVFSNVGYVFSFVPVLIGYYFLRRWRPELRRPFRLPEWMKYVALALAAYYLFTWAVAIPWCALSGCANGGVGNVLPAYFIGILVLLLYFPIYLLRRRQDRMHAVSGGSGRDDEA
ncbi:MAG: APC family permease [Candidatus Dormibacterales bacterium]